MEYAAELRDVSKSFAGLQSPVLQSLTLNLPKRAVTSIIGRNGSGKTTLLRIVALLERPDSGSLRLLGHDSEDAQEELRGRIAMVFQHPVVFDRSVYDNVAFPQRLRGVHEDAVKRGVHQLCDKLGLTVFMNRNARSLSGGQKQRVVLARTLAAGPELLLLDEPNNSLDREGLAALEEIVNEFKRESTVVVTTPDLSYAMSIGDFFAVLEDASLQFFSDKRSFIDFVGAQG